MTTHLAHLEVAPIDAHALASSIEADIGLPQGARLTPVGITGLTPMSARRIVGLTCRLLRKFEEAGLTGNALMWAIGDAVNEGEAQWGDTYTDALASTGYAYQTVANAAWVAGKVPFSLRREPPVTWTHHEVVAALTRDEQAYWLARVIEDELSTRALRDLIQEQQDVEAGRDPVVASAERALERAKAALWRVPEERRAEVVVKTLIDPLAGLGAEDAAPLLRLRGEYITASVNGSEERVAKVLGNRDPLALSGLRLLVARAGVEITERILGDGQEGD